MHWVVAARRSRTEIFERRLQECALWVRIASATSFLLAYRDLCGQTPGMIELCQARAQQLREDVAQAEKYWRKHPRRIERHMAASVKLHIFTKYWYLANDPLFAVLRSELSTPAGTVLGLSSPEVQQPGQFWRGIPLAMAAGPLRRPLDQGTFEEEQGYGGYSAPRIIAVGPHFYHRPPLGVDPGYAGHDYGTGRYPDQSGQHEVDHSRYGDRDALSPNYPSREQATQLPPVLLMTPALTRPTSERPSSYASVDTGDRSPSRDSRRRRQHDESDRTRHDSSSNSRYRSADRNHTDHHDTRRHSASSWRSESPTRSRSSRRRASSNQHANYEDAYDSDTASRSCPPSSRRSSAHLSSYEYNDHVHVDTRSNSIASTTRYSDSIFSHAPSSSSKSSYVSTQRSERSSNQTTGSGRSSRSQSVDEPLLETQRTRGGGDRRCPPISAMNETKARERVRRDEKKEGGTEKRGEGSGTEDWGEEGVGRRAGEVESKVEGMIARKGAVMSISLPEAKTKQV